MISLLCHYVHYLHSMHYIVQLKQWLTEVTAGLFCRFGWFGLDPEKPNDPTLNYIAIGFAMARFVLPFILLDFISTRIRIQVHMEKLHCKVQNMQYTCAFDWKLADFCAYHPFENSFVCLVVRLSFFSLQITKFAILWSIRGTFIISTKAISYSARHMCVYWWLGGLFVSRSGSLLLGLLSFAVSLVTFDSLASTVAWWQFSCLLDWKDTHFNLLGIDF